MAIAYVRDLLHTRDSADGTTYNQTTIGSVTPSSSNLVVLLIAGRRASVMADPTSVTVCGVTAIKRTSLSHANDQNNISIWTANGAFSGSTITVVWPTTEVNCDFMAGEFSGCDNTNHIVSGQVATTQGTATSGTATLPSTPTSGAVWGGFSHQTNETATAGSGWTGLTVANGANPNTSLIGEYQLANDQTCDASWTTSSAYLGAVVELAAASSGVTGTAAWTEDADTCTGAAFLAFTGTSAWTEATDTCAATGNAQVTGTAAWTEVSDTSTGAGFLAFTGTATWTEIADTCAATGSVSAYIGTSAWTEAADTCVAAGTFTASGPITFFPVRHLSTRAVLDGSRRTKTSSSGKSSTRAVLSGSRTTTGA